MTTWLSKTAFENWLQSEDFKLAHRNPMPEEAFYGSPSTEYHEVVVIAEKQQVS